MIDDKIKVVKEKKNSKKMNRIIINQLKSAETRAK